MQLQVSTADRCVWRALPRVFGETATAGSESGFAPPSSSSPRPPQPSGKAEHGAHQYHQLSEPEPSVLKTPVSESFEKILQPRTRAAGRGLERGPSPGSSAFCTAHGLPLTLLRRAPSPFPALMSASHLSLQTPLHVLFLSEVFRSFKGSQSPQRLVK